MTPGWTPVVSAVVAVVGTLAAAIFTQIWNARREDKRRADDLAERNVAHDREDRFRLYQERRITYVKYLKALHDTSEAIRETALSIHADDASRRQATANSFRNSGILAAREEITLLATLDLAVAARRAFLSVGVFRDLVARGEALDSPEVTANWKDHREALSGLRAEMRRSLGVPLLGDPAALGPGL
jgi:hypothetical protein